MFKPSRRCPGPSRNHHGLGLIMSDMIQIWRQLEMLETYYDWDWRSFRFLQVVSGFDSHSYDRRRMTE